jgi:hypothetical protein
VLIHRTGALSWRSEIRVGHRTPNGLSLRGTLIGCSRERMRRSFGSPIAPAAIENRFAPGHASSGWSGRRFLRIADVSDIRHYVNARVLFGTLIWKAGRIRLRSRGRGIWPASSLLKGAYPLAAGGLRQPSSLNWRRLDEARGREPRTVRGLLISHGKMRAVGARSRRVRPQPPFSIRRCGISASSTSR